MARFVLWGTYCEDALVKRAPYRDEHLARLGTSKRRERLSRLVQPKEYHIFGIFGRTTSPSFASLLDDIYWKQGIWTALEVYPWVQAF